MVQREHTYCQRTDRLMGSGSLGLAVCGGACNEIERVERFLIVESSYVRLLRENQLVKVC